MATMAEILQEENQRLREQLTSVEERLQNEIEVNRSLIEQAQLIDASLPLQVKDSRYADAYEPFEQYNSGYGHVGTHSEGRERPMGAVDIDRVLTILYEVRAALEEKTSISSQVQIQGEASPLEHLQTVAKELQSRSAEFAEFLSSYVNMLTKQNITGVRLQTNSNLEPYFAEKSDLRQVTYKLASLYESGLFIKQEDMSTMSSDLHTAVLGVISALIHVLQEQLGDQAVFRSSH